MNSFLRQAILGDDDVSEFRQDPYVAELMAAAVRPPRAVALPRPPKANDDAASGAYIPGGGLLSAMVEPQMRTPGMTTPSMRTSGMRTPSMRMQGPIHVVGR
jgi:hypothetical protein